MGMQPLKMVGILLRKVFDSRRDKNFISNFENSLCGKELAVKTQTLNATNLDIYFMSKIFKQVLFKLLKEEHLMNSLHGNILA